MIKQIVYNVVLGTIALSSAAIATSVTNPACTPAPSNVSNNTNQVAANSMDTAALEQSIFNQINNYRASQGLPALTRNSAIDNQVRLHSKNMGNGTVSFGHSGFSERLNATGVSYRSAAENVAYNQGYSDPATKAVQGWLKSPGHLTNIRGNYNLTGIGVAKNSQGAIYFTQIFIRS
ncbi:CAP domain-containing protein [Nostoc sp. 'Peltigera malacea cyanobiont' DB3992]|uniref:CAP domain-containing protein n=1 Tax=Nostoc sp. 'Peltigera malacea cyanobiont' DB3992 TaxID=1206980 RepID=UPI000C039969|nr:CAP domain-containing protein [Nostoc sp. 'Peltigera malacea cyanobiont' DB3992]PHM08348.1 alkaline-shock protein [Nostoc sp. 'Peltigera malacea cyanobiont' DB3992]